MLIPDNALVFSASFICTLIIKSGSPSSSSVMFWESGKVVRTAELHLTVNVGSNIDQRDFQPAVENGMQPI